MELNGVPLHPLVVHAVVVLGPLAALTGLAYAVVPRWRWLLRWPLVVLAVVTAASAFLATQSGEALLESRPELAPLVEEHEERGELLRNVALGYAAGLAAGRVGARRRLGAGVGQGCARRPGSASRWWCCWRSVRSRLAVCLFLAGDSGARAVWG